MTNERRNRFFEEPKTPIDQPKEEKILPKVEPPKVEEKKVESKPTAPPLAREDAHKERPVIVSHTDAYIYDKVQSQPKTLEDVEIESRVAKDPNKHQLSLPEELEEFGKKYAFRWLFKHKRAIDYATDVRGWVLVNKSHFGTLPEHLFTMNGSIERGDSILAFMPIDKAEELRKHPGQRSNDIIRGTLNKHKGDPRYYTPKVSVDGDSQVVGI